MFVIIASALVALTTALSVDDIEINAALLRDHHQQRQLFEVYQAEFEKVYESDEELHFRRKVFMKNLLEMHQLNKRAKSLNATTRYGVNHLSDWTKEEFKARLLMKEGIKTVSTDEALRLRDARGEPALNKGNPTTLDYRTKGLVTRVKNQGQCGSCWAFSATEEIESKYLQLGKGNVNTLALSPQQIVSCDDTSMGCGGGEPTSAYAYVKNAGGIVSNMTIPYQAVDGVCQSSKVNKNTIVAEVVSWKPATSWYSESELENTLVSSGAPVSVCVDAANWMHYKTGVMTRWECDPIDTLDHCVQLVGYDNSHSTPYWMIRNSWTTKWGIDGYIHVAKSWDACGVADQATIVTVK